MLSVEGSKLESIPHFGCLGQSVVEFIIVGAVWCETHSQGSHALCGFDPLDVVICVKVCTRCQMDFRVIGLCLHHAWDSGIVELPLYSIPKTLEEI
jgi:hypothetical protein